MNVELGGELIELLPQRAAYWPRRRSLVVADVHFGKAATFRSHWIPVPRGTTGENLAALDALLFSRDTEELIFLGDFLHARQAQAPPTLDAIRRWRRRRPALRLVLVRGNHDMHA
ncbi:MAG: metallophosphoesterase, partial [Lautropia sp.]